MVNSFDLKERERKKFISKLGTSGRIGRRHIDGWQLLGLEFEPKMETMNRGIDVDCAIAIGFSAPASTAPEN